MANDINKVILIGNLTRNPELKYLQSGTAVCKFSIANNKQYTSNNKKKKEVSFFEIVAWSKLGEVINEYCKKGNKICVEGRLSQRSWDDSEGKKRTAIEVVAENIQFLSTNNVNSNDNSDDNTASIQVENAFADSSDLPF